MSVAVTNTVLTPVVNPVRINRPRNFPESYVNPTELSSTEALTSFNWYSEVTVASTKTESETTWFLTGNEILTNTDWANREFVGRIRRDRMRSKILVFMGISSFSSKIRPQIMQKYSHIIYKKSTVKFRTHFPHFVFLTKFRIIEQ